MMTATRVPLSETESFLYHVTHDLKAHTRALREIPTWLAEDLAASNVALPDDVVEHLSLLSSASAGLDRMLDALTELSRVGRLADPPDAHSVAHLALDVWNSVPGVAAARLNIDGDAIVRGPENDFRRLLSALFRNAVQHNTAEQPSVRVAIFPRDDRVDISISDNGPGIEPRFRQRVFEALQTLQPKSATGSAWIGLTVARKVVSQHGGQIGIADTASGCRVDFDLPKA